MRTLIISALGAALLPLAATPSRAEPSADQLTIEAEPALAEVDARPAGPRIIRLPNMAFTLRIDAQCGADMRAESASVSISDARYLLSAEDLSDAAGTELTIEVPHKQLAPLTIENFCFSDSEADAKEELLIADAMTAQVSLRCVSETQQSIIYSAAPLGIALRCKTGDD